MISIIEKEMTKYPAFEQKDTEMIHEKVIKEERRSIVT